MALATPSPRLTISLAIAGMFYALGFAPIKTLYPEALARPLGGFHDDVNLAATHVTRGFSISSPTLRASSPQARELFFGGVDRRVKAVIARVGS